MRFIERHSFLLFYLSIYLFIKIENELFKYVETSSLSDEVNMYDVDCDQNKKSDKVTFLNL